MRRAMGEGKVQRKTFREKRDRGGGEIDISVEGVNNSTILHSKLNTK